MCAVADCVCESDLRAKVDESGCQVARAAVVITATESYCDSIAERRPVSHPFAGSKTWSTRVVRLDESGNSGPACGNLGHGL